MNPQLIQLFRDALDLAVQDRNAYLDVHCTDAALRAQIDALLIASESTALPMPECAHMADLLAETAPSESGLLDRTGQIVGPFRLTKLLGSGGMGAVWQAERMEGFAQTVAIKWAHAAGLSAAILTRFAQERQLLAKLNHPGIARVVDGGSDAGALWFAMEYVDGLALDRYVEAVNPSLEARLKLVIELCAAVQYAHQNLIVHRDLKPGNIMVLNGGSPKLLDFGIAKQLGGTPELTQSAAPMTFSYAAPEQIRGDTITTAVDVYALGVILFELLTGERPHKPINRVGGDGALSLLQAITDTDATAPSSALAIRTNVHSSIRPSQLKGDLDTIVLKALSRDTARRYASAQALSDDINAYLAQRPIRARPDSASYRLLKFVRRNQGAVASGVLALAALVGLSAYSLQQAQRAKMSAADSARQADLMQVEADQANVIVAHMTAVLTRAQAAGDTVRTAELMAWAADTELSGRYADPVKNRAIKLAVSDILMTGNEFAPALKILDALVPQLADAQPRERLQAYANRTRALYRLGRLPEAEQSLIMARLSLPAKPILLSAQLKIYEGEIARTLGHNDQAIAAAVQATELIDRADDANAFVRGTVFSSAATGLMQLGELDRAQRYAERALQIWQQAQVQHSASIQNTETTLANAQFLRGHLRASLAMFAAIQSKASASESVPPRAARSSGHAKALALLQQFDAANAMIETARADMCAATGESSLDCIGMTLAAADVAQVSRQRHAEKMSGRVDLAAQLVKTAQTRLGNRDVAPIQARFLRFKLTAAVLAKPTEANIDALIGALVQPSPSGMARRSVVRTLLVLAQQLSQEHAKSAARLAAIAIDQARALPVEAGGMDRALIALWQAKLANRAPAANAIQELALALGDAHPWVQEWRYEPAAYLTK